MALCSYNTSIRPTYNISVWYSPKFSHQSDIAQSSYNTSIWYSPKFSSILIHSFAPQFPPRGAPIGHNRDAVMVPFYPRHFHRWYFTDSRGLGYDYDNFNYGKSGKVKFVESGHRKYLARNLTSN